MTNLTTNKKGQSPLTVIAATLGLTVLSTAAIAGPNNHSFSDYAKVTNVQPIYETVSYREPHKECYIEQRQVHRKRSNTPEIIGALIGGAIGNKLGHNKSNKRVGALAGAILGGSIARDANRGDHHGSFTTNEEVCHVSHTVHQEQQVTGYNVDYKYRGRQYQTVMNQHPGKRIRVAVDVRPINY